MAQLVRKLEDSDLHHLGGIPLSIQDAPRYAYRGLMLDTARHFFSVDYLKKLMDNLSLAKFSVLHWHIVDDESFPLDIPSQPTLAKNAAYSAKEVYSTQDALDIVAYG